MIYEERRALYGSYADIIVSTVGVQVVRRSQL
jgi:hypothetical protein